MDNSMYTRAFVRGSIGFFLGVVVLGLQGCSKPVAEAPSGEKKAPAASEAPSEATAPPIQAQEPAKSPALDVPSLVARINGAEDMIDWHAQRAAYLAQADRDSEVDAALATREAALLAQSPALPISEELELVALDWALDGESSAEGKDENFRATWLFKVKKKIELEEGVDVRLILRGWFDKAHQHYFGPDDKYFQLTYKLVPPISDWEAGSYHLVALKTYRKVPNLPYRLHTFLEKVRQTEDGGLTPGGRHGEIADSGWRADLGAAAAPPAQQ